MTKRKLLFIISVLFTLVFFAQDARKYTTHVVKEGETLKIIAKIYDCKVKDIKDLNPDIDENQLFANTTLVIPNTKKNIEQKVTEKVKEEEKVVIYIVEEGNTVFSIAKKFNVTMQSLRDANNLINDNLQPGQKLRIPSKNEFIVKPTDNKVEFYQVKKGDTKWRIATLYKITVEELDALNPELVGEIKEGQYIWVPDKDIEVITEVKETYQQEQDPSSYIYHVVKEKESLFRIAVIYSSTQEEIQVLNPEAVKKLRPGMLLKIPAKKKDRFITHKVEKGDTFYNLSKKYKVSEENLILINPELKDGLKLGSTIFIKPKNDKKSIQNNFNIKKTNTIKISFLMPMMSDSTYTYGKNTSESQLRTIVADFYLGAQMAIEEFEKKGINIDYHVYDYKNNSNTIAKIAEIEDVKKSDVIIGPFFFDKAEIVAEKLNDIPVFAPLYSKKQDQNHQPNLIKTGIFESNVSDAIAEFFIENYKKQNIVIISDFSEINLKHAKNIETLLSENKIPFQKIVPTKNTKNEKVLNINSASLKNAIDNKENTWVILLSENNGINSQIISDYGTDPNISVRLFTNKQFEPYSNIDFNHLVKLKWTFPAVQFDKVSNPEIDEFKNLFREKNFAFPEYYVFTGYDLTYDIISRIASGNLINSLDNEKTVRLTRSFDYKKTEYSDYKNTGVLMYYLNSNFEYELAK